MLRASLLQLGEHEHVLLVTMHHIASDGWSLRVFWRELEVLYDAYCRDADAELEELPVQYADYTVWQRKELEGARLDRLLQYWRRQLAGVSALELPTDRPRPPVPTYHGARHHFELKDELVDQLKLLGQAEGVTLHMTLLAAFQLLLSRYSGQDDIAVGTPIAGRNHAELEDQIGFFVNTLVLRTDLCKDPTFRELLGRVRQVSLAVYDHQDLTYRELNERANQLAHYLRDQGVGRETLVGICMERSCDLLTSLLAVAKSGGAYVPLDPSHPKQRVAYILGNSQAAVLITEERLIAELGENLTTICADRDGATIAQQSTNNPDPISGPEDLVYVIYTSGSTGKPKGVMIEHRPLVNCLWSMRKRPGLEERDILLAVTTISFDIAALELYLPLICGAQVVIANDEESGDVRKLTALIESRGVTLMQATPATWQMMLDIGWQGCESLRILCGGEALPRSLANQLLEKGQMVWNIILQVTSDWWHLFPTIPRTNQPLVSCGNICGKSYRITWYLPRSSSWTVIR